MSTLKLEHIAHIDNAGPDISIDSSGHMNIVNGNLQMGGVTMLDASNGDLSTGNNASVNIRDAAGEVAGRIRNWSSPTNSIAIESDPLNSAAGSYLTFTVDGSQKMTILGNNVGIGDTTPSNLLSVEGSTSGNFISIINNTHNSNGSGLKVMGGDDANTTAFRVTDYNNTALVEVQGGGNVGIGTTSPDQNSKLDVYSTTGSWTRISARDATSSAFTGVYRQSGTVSAGVFAHNSALNAWEDLWINAHNNGSGGVGGGTSNKVIIGGNVGIGTTNPTSKLHTDGAMVSTNLAQGSGELQIQGYGNTGYINMNGSGSLIFRMGSSYSADLKLTSAGILQGSSDAEIKTSPIRKHSNTISTNTTIDSSENAIASGPISVATGVTLTINGNMTVV